MAGGSVGARWTIGARSVSSAAEEAVRPALARARFCRPGAPPTRSARPVILAIDQGTTGTTCVVVDEGLRVCGRGYRELPQHFPRPGWVEHDPWEIWATVVGAAEAAVRAA